ncbi:UNVERIFIED_CONTAM: hypothetical protein Sindi_1331200, partial [Sesamum indicum]
MEEVRNKEGMKKSRQVTEKRVAQLRVFVCQREEGLMDLGESVRGFCGSDGGGHVSVGVSRTFLLGIQCGEGYR